MKTTAGIKGKHLMKPNNWEYFHLDQLSNKITVGIATEVSPHICESGIPLIRNQNIRAGYFNGSDIIFISKEFDKANANKRLRANDVIIVRTGSNVGMACVVPKEHNNSQTFTTLIVRPNNNIDPHFLSIHINSLGIREVDRLSAGGGKPNLNAGFLKKYKLLLPTMPEQKLIVDIIGKWDKAILDTQLLIEQKILFKKSLMRKLLSGQTRVKGSDSKWETKNIGYFLRESRISSNSSNPDKRITVKLNLNGIEKRDFRGTESEDATYFFVRKAGQFIYGKQNLHKGAFGIIPLELDGFESSQDIPAFDFINEINPQYFLWFLSQESVYLSLDKIASGTGSKRIQPEAFFKLTFAFPSLTEQTKIVKILNLVENDIRIIKDKLNLLLEQKKILTNGLLTGEIRVRK